MIKKILFFNLVVLLLSCQKEDLPEAPNYSKGKQEFGFAKGEKNGQLFEASPFAWLVNSTDSTKCNINIRTELQETVWREYLVLVFVPMKPGTYRKFGNGKAIGDLKVRFFCAYS